jgi:chromosome segregation ATPase
MDTIRIKSTDEASQGPFVVIARADFNLDHHEAIDPADLDHVPTEQPRTLTTKDLDEARAELERRHDELMAMRADLDARHESLNSQAAEQEAERTRLTEWAAKLAEQSDAKPLGIAALREALTARGIAFDADAKKADLQALLDQNPAQ